MQIRRHKLLEIKWLSINEEITYENIWLYSGYSHRSLGKVLREIQLKLEMQMKKKITKKAEEKNREIL